MSGCRESAEKRASRAAAGESSTAVAVKATGSMANTEASSAHASVPVYSVMETPAVVKPAVTLRASTSGADAPGAHSTRTPAPADAT